jgi:hypothetical protein
VAGALVGGIHLRKGEGKEKSKQNQGRMHRAHGGIGRVRNKNHPLGGKNTGRMRKEKKKKRKK